MTDRLVLAGVGDETPSPYKNRLSTVTVLIKPQTLPSGTPEKLGSLYSCIDRRFVENVGSVFSEVTGLAPGQFWHGATAGGAAGIRGSLETLASEGYARDDVAIGIEHARDHGARVWGWQAHGDNCGGLPGKSDSEVEDQLYGTAQVANEILPGQHYIIFQTNRQAVARRVI